MRATLREEIISCMSACTGESDKPNKLQILLNILDRHNAGFRLGYFDVAYLCEFSGVSMSKLSERCGKEDDGVFYIDSGIILNILITVACDTLIKYKPPEALDDLISKLRYIFGTTISLSVLAETCGVFAAAFEAADNEVKELKQSLKVSESHAENVYKSNVRNFQEVVRQKVEIDVLRARIRALDNKVERDVQLARGDELVGWIEGYLRKCR